MAGPSDGGRMRSVAAEPSVAASERILALLQLDRVAIADQLAHVIASFRPTQVALLFELLIALQSTDALAHIVAHFDRKLDVKGEMEWYLTDLLKMHHYITHHGVDAELTRRMMELYGTFGDSGDRQLLAKVFQTLGFALCSVYCSLNAKLPPKLQQELLTLFADDLPELRMWIQWLATVRSKDDKRNGAVATATAAGRSAAATTSATTRSNASVGDNVNDAVAAASPSTAFSDALQLVVRTVYERCTMSWLALLRPLSSTARVAVVHAVNTCVPSTSLKHLARFYETSGVALETYLMLDVAMQQALPMLLLEFPAATLQTLFAKFNSAVLVQSVLVGLDALPKRELVRLVDALGIADQRAVDVFATALFQYARLAPFVQLFLTLSTPNQLHVVNMLRDAAVRRVTGDSGSSNDAGPTDNHDSVTTTPLDRSATSATASSPNAAAWRVFDLFLDANFRSNDAVVQKLATLSTAAVRAMVAASAEYTPDELATLGDGLERVASSCLPQFLHIFALLPAAARLTLVQWVRDVPDDAASPVYDVLLVHLEASDSDSSKLAVKILEVVVTLSPRDKRLLCTDVLATAATAAEPTDAATSARALNDSILRYLCDCALPLHKAVKLFRLLPAAQYNRLLYLLRTQRVPEQVALARLMLRLARAANCRLLAQLDALSTSAALDLFFELLLLIPPVEIESFAKLVVSPSVTFAQLQCFVDVAASLQNQASSRELVLFTAALPTRVRDLLFDMLGDDPVKGVLLRIVACASKLSADVLQALLALLHPLPWTARSALVEQIRALETSADTERLVAAAQDFVAPHDLERFVLLLNVLPVPVRIALVQRVQLLAHDAKRCTLAQLDALPKAQLQHYCAQLCASGRDDVGAAFLLVFGVLDRVYDGALLALLERESRWPLLLLLADRAARTPEPSLFNGFCASLALLTAHEHALLALHSVVNEALASGTSLHALVLVLCHFRSAPRLLAFLAFAQRVGRVARTTRLFRVLAASRQPAFIFDVCCMLDLDDALFALTRLDRLRHDARAAALDDALDDLATRFAATGVAIKDEFCNVVLGFYERSVSSSADASCNNSGRTRFIAPRVSHDTVSESAAQSLGAVDADNDAVHDVLYVPSTRSMTHPALSLARHLRHMQTDDLFARQWESQRLAAAPSDELQEAAAAATVEHVPVASSRSNNVVDSDDVGENVTSMRTAAEHALDAHQADPPDIAVAATGEAIDSSSVLPTIASTTASCRSTSSRGEAIVSMLDSNFMLDSDSDLRVESSSSSSDRTRARAQSGADVLTMLPPLFSQPPVLRAKRAVDAVLRASVDVTDTTRRTSAQQLSRSESAPTTLLSASATSRMLTLSTSQSSSPNERARHYRGLAAALDAPSDCHIVRDRGASIFRKECDAATAANNTCRIRVSKSLAAQSHVNAVRVQRRLGKRDVHNNSVPLASPLLRPDRHTIEQATAVLALAARAREVETESLCTSIR